MRFKLFAGLLTLAAAVLVAAPPPAPSSARQQQQDDQDVIEGFVTTRGAAFGERPKKPANNNASAATQPKKSGRFSGGVGSSNKSAKSTKQTTGATTTAKAQADAAPGKNGKPATNTANAAPPAGPDAAAKTPAHHAAAQPDARPADDTTPATSAEPAVAVGLGYTILLVGADGSNTVADPSRAFAAGDKIRVALETNADGYLYIFNAENDSPEALMLYPHAAVDGGSNRIAAHARDYFPADLRYTFEFDDAAATEHLYIIFSRRPLADVPAGQALLEHCGANREACYWKPAPEQWARIKAAAAQGRVVESRNRDLAAARDPLPPATSRGIKVKKDEPAPAVVRMNASAQSDVLLTKIQLVHK